MRNNISRDPDFTLILFVSGLWNILIAMWALFLPESFSSALEIDSSSIARILGSQVFWVVIAIAGSGYALSGYNNAGYRIFISAGVPGKIAAFFGFSYLWFQGYVGLLGLGIGIGDLLFTIPLIKFLKATPQYGWV